MAWLWWALPPKLREEKGLITLSFELANNREGFQGLAKEFTPIKRGERRYLIHPSEMVDFCNKINYGTEGVVSVFGRVHPTVFEIMVGMRSERVDVLADTFDGS
jgi:hypothetical protein